MCMSARSSPISVPRSMTVDWLGQFAARLEAELGWSRASSISAAGSASGTCWRSRRSPSASSSEACWRSSRAHGSCTVFRRRSSLSSRDGHSSPAPAVTLYTVGGMKRAARRRRSSPSTEGCPTTPAPRSTAPATRRCSRTRGRSDDGRYAVAGKHCESGDVLIDRVELPVPRRGDLLAVPVTGAYTLSMSSTYNAVPRPPAVLVWNGEARLIRRRETIADLLELET